MGHRHAAQTRAFPGCRTRARFRIVALGASLVVIALGCSSQGSTLTAGDEQPAPSHASKPDGHVPPAKPDGHVPPGGYSGRVAATTRPQASSPTKEALDLEAAGVFGLRPGPADPDAVLASLSKVLGAPTRDTGWYDISGAVLGDGTDDCTGGVTQRVLRWGDLSLAFWRPGPAADADVLWSWTVGDPAASLWGDRHEPPVPAVTPVPLTSAEGVHVGSTVQDLLALYGTRLTLIVNGQVADPATATSGVLSLSPAPPLVDQADVGFAFRDGVVTGIGGTLSFC